jgi:Domain of unknown function (DUF6924)
MKPIAETQNSLVLRTDFSDDAAWNAVCSAVQAPQGPFGANVDLVSDREYEDATFAQLVAAATEIADRTFMFVVDRTTVTHVEYPIAVLDLWSEPGRSFRLIPSEMWSVENNLSIANMDFDEFADAVDADGIFRGFPRST